jgi:hypothetical protein
MPRRLGMEAKHHTFLNFTLNGVVSFTLRPLNPWVRTCCPSDRKTQSLRASLNVVKKREIQNSEKENNKKKKGVLGRTNLLSSDTTRTAQKTTPPTILRCRGNVFTELLPSNERGIHRPTDSPLMRHGSHIKGRSQHAACLVSSLPRERVYCAVA